MTDEKFMSELDGLRVRLKAVEDEVHVRFGATEEAIRALQFGATKSYAILVGVQDAQSRLEKKLDRLLELQGDKTPSIRPPK